MFKNGVIMDSKDSKLKFLPRHLQRTQPAASHKSKRRVTVEDENNCDEESDRRSVFERLGPGGSRTAEKPCFEFLEEGKCKYGSTCVYSHNIKAFKKRDTDKSPDNLRLKFKGGKEKDTKLRSQVVVRKAGGSDDDSEEESDGWSLDIDKLESKKELELEQKRKELLLSLSVLDEEGSGDVKKSDSSDSDSSPDRRNKKKKDKMGKKKDKKKHKKGDRELSVEKFRDGKRRHDSDDEKSSPHKKRKKKKMDKRPGNESPSPTVPSQAGKHKKSIPATKSSSKGSDLYNPESPTMDPVKEASHEGKKKRSSSSSPSPKSKLKKKKKKGKESQDAGGKSRKLLSPLMKVLKVKKGGPGSVSSKRSRSRSREPVHKRSRSSSSSPSSSASPAPARKKKPVISSVREPIRKKSRSLEKKKRTLRTHRAGSSSSSSSSASSPSPRKGKKGSAQRPSRPESGSKKERSVSTGRGRHDTSVGRRKDSRPRDSRPRDASIDKKRGKATEDRGRARDRGNRKDTQVSPASHRRPVSQTHRDRDTSRDHRDSKNEPAKGSDRDRDRERDRDRDRDRDSNRGATRSGDSKKEISSRDRDKGGDRDKGVDREKDSGRGGRDKGRDNDKGDRDASRGERDVGRRDREKDVRRDKEVGRDREKEVGRDREKEAGRDREKEVGRDREKEVGRRDREVGKGDRERETGRGEREREVNRSDRGERELGRVERDIGRGERDMGRGDRDMGRGEREMGRGEIARGELGRGEREIGRGEREMGRGERELSRGEIVRGEREMGRGEREIVRDDRDLIRGERDMVRGEREIVRGERDMVRGDIRDRNRRSGSLDRDREERLRREQLEFGGPNPPLLPLDRGGRFPLDLDFDRPFDEPGRFRGADLGPPRMGMFHEMDVPPRLAFGRGFGGDPFDRREMRGFDPRMERGRPIFQTFGRGRDRSWERGQERGRDNRRFGDFRGDDRAREFGSGNRDGREERLLPFPPGGSSDNKGLLPSPVRDGGRLDDNPRDDIRSRDNDREDNWKRRGGSHDSKDQDNNRNRRKEDGNSDDRFSHERGLSDPSTTKNKQTEKDVSKDSKKEVPDTTDKSKLSASAKIKASPVKEESPLTRDEPSLASLFSQTETVGPKKKPPAKSFGGKKSPKTSEDTRKNTDKSKSTINSRMNTRRTVAARSAEKKTPVSKLGDSKDDGKVTNKGDGAKKDKRTPSPKSSQKSGDSSRSVPDQSKTKKTPEPKTSRSPAPKRNADRSVRKVSPGPGSKDKDNKTDDKARSLSPNTAASDKKKEEVAKTTKPDTNIDKKKPRSRSGSLSGVDHKPAAIGGNKSTDVEKSRRKSSDSESQVKDEEGDIAAAMLGDSIDEKQDEIVFSDWSEDDDADNILLGGDRRKNQVEDLDHDEFERENSVRDMRARRSPAGGGRVYGGGRLMDGGGRLMDFNKHGLGDILNERPALEKNIPNVKILEDVQKEKPARERRKRNEDDEGYEEISSDENELDEEGERISKRTIVSILDIDLAALMPQSKPRAAPGPVFQRYKPASIFAELGLSKAYAGDALYAEVQEVCQKQLEALTEGEHRTEEVPVENVEKEAPISQPKPSVKVEAIVKKEMVELSMNIKQETNVDDGKDNVSEQEEAVVSSDADKNEASSEKSSVPASTATTKSASLTTLPKPEFKLFGTTSAYHKLFKARTQQKSALLDNAGLFRRALTARKDLDIRRQLCRIDPKYDQGAVYPSGPGDPQLTRECLQLFRARRPQHLVLPSKKPVKTKSR